MERADLEDVIERVKGVACLCVSLSISSEAGKSKYAGSEMSLLADALDGIVLDLERVGGGGLDRLILPSYCCT